MDFNAPVSEQAATLLRKIDEVGKWATGGDPRAKPYLDADAVRVVDGVATFHRDRFLTVYGNELTGLSYELIDRTTPSGKVLFRCRLCGHQTPAPTKNHPCGEKQ